MGDPGVPDLGRGEARRGARVEKATKGRVGASREAWKLQRQRLELSRDGVSLVGRVPES